MKKIIIGIVLLCLLGTVEVYSQGNLKTNTNEYSMKFAFTGKIKNAMDSIFEIQYTFTRRDFSNYSALVLQDSTMQRQIRLNQPANDSVEIRYTANQAIVTLKKYDKNNLPVLVQSIDKQGKRNSMYRRMKDGKRLDPALLLKEEKISHRFLIQHDSTGTPSLNNR